MANTIDIGNTTSLIIKIPARGETNWSQEFKTYFADKLADHDHTSSKGARIKNAALVTYTMVNNGDVFEDFNGNEIAYVETDITVSTDTIQNSAITNEKIADDAVDGAKIAANSITTDHIAPDTVIAADIATNAITEDELRDDAFDDSLRAVSTNHIKDANITTAKIQDEAVTTQKIASASVTTAKIATDAITIDKMANSSVGYYELVDGSVGTSKISSLSVITDKLANDAVTTDKIADSNVTTAKIADANVTTAKLNDDSVTKEKINADVAGNGIGQNVDGSLEVNVDNSTIEIDTDSLRLKDLGITTAKLADASVTTAKIADANVTRAKLDSALETDLTNLETGITSLGSMLGSDGTWSDFGGSNYMDGNSDLTTSLINLDSQVRINRDDIDTITTDISNLELSSLTDVSLTAPTEQQSLVWNSSSNKWEPGTTTIQNLVAGTDTYTEIGASIINIDTSSSGFTISANLENKIINVTGSYGLYITADSLTNVTIKSNHDVDIRSPHTSLSSGQPSIYNNLDITTGGIIYIRPGFQQLNPGGGGYNSIPTKVYNSKFNCINFSLVNQAVSYWTWSNSSSTNNMLLDTCSIITKKIYIYTVNYPAEFYTCNIVSKELSCNLASMDIDQGTSVVTNTTNSNFASCNNFNAPSSLSTTTQYLK